MKKLYALCLFFLINAAVRAQAPSWLWAKSAGGSGDDQALSIANDTQGNIYAAGFFTSPIMIFGSDTLTNTGLNMFLAKYDATGNIIWAKTSGGSNHNYGNSVTTDNAGNVYVAGYFSSNTILFDTILLTRHDTTVIWANLFLVKYDSSGNVIWARNTTKGASTASAVTTDNLGNIFISGNCGADSLVIGPDTLFPPSNYDRFVAKYDTAGNGLWVRGLYTGGGAIDVDAPFISADKYGNLYITGNFHVNVCVIVSTNLVMQGDDDIYLAKFNSAGNLLWAKRYGESGEDKASSIASDTSGNIYITGYFTSNNIDFDSFTLPGIGYTAFVVKLDAGGTAVWAEKFGRLDYPAPTKITADRNGDVYVTGQFSSPALVFTSADSLVNEGLFLAKYDNNGNFKWARDAVRTGIKINKATSVCADSFGNLYIAGYFASDTLIFDATTLLDSTSSFDILIAAISSLVSVEENNALAENTFSLFPNPSHGKFYILTNPNDQGTVVIYDMIGKEIDYKIISPGIQQLDLSGQPKGIYFISIKTESKSYSKRIIIQ